VIKTIVMKRDAFKANDIRGRVPDELNEEMAYRIGRVFVELFAARRVVVGRDVRLSSESLAGALIRGLVDMGCDVVDIGLCGTEMVYFATAHLGVDGGIMVTASHNPIDYNGMKLVGKDARPISGDSGLRALENLVVTGDFSGKKHQNIALGQCNHYSIMQEYIQHLLTYIDVANFKPLKVVVNSGNGCAGPIIDALAEFLPIEFVKVYHEPDGTFPHGIPNPLLVENREATAIAVRENSADFGIAWDGDFDRCFLFDEQGDFIEGYYIVGFLAEAFLRRYSGAKIIHDPRLTWNTIELVKEAGGTPILCKTGHAFIKERMREEDAVYGGELSAHHYFRDFAYCDSGMIPWLLVVDNLSVVDKALSELVGARIGKFPVSGEINRIVSDGRQVLAAIEEQFVTEGAVVDRTDGLSVEFATWRFNVRTSNTEPLLRLNVESRGDATLMMEKTKQLLAAIEAVG